LVKNEKEAFMKKLGLVVLAVLMVVVAGTVSAGGVQAGAGPQSGGGTLVIGETVLDTQMATKNPFFPSNTKQALLPFMYERLMYFNPISGELEPEIATSYEWSDNFMTLIFTLRQGDVWHDGQPVTPDDVVFTYNALKKEPVLDRFSLWSKLSSVSAEGDKVIFKLSQSFTSLPFYSNDIFIVPKHIWEKLPSIAEALNQTPVGSGPFVWSAYNTGTDVQFKANKNYWRGAPKVDNLVVQIYNNAPNLTLALLRGDVQATLETIAMANIPELLGKPHAKLQKYAGLNNFVVALNLENELLTDVNVRKAMTMAINVADLITRGEYNGVFPSSAGWLPELFGDLLSDNAKKPHVYDPVGAQKVLQDAGYTKGNDGIYQKNGKRLSFTYHNASGAPAQQMEAGMIQQWLLNIGIEIIPRLATWAELSQLLQTGRYDLLQNGIGFPADPYAALNTTFHSSRTAPSGQATVGTNYFRYRNPRVDTLLDEVSGVTDAAIQKTLYGQIQDILINDVPFLPMYNTGGHIPYYDGARYSGWIEDAPIFCSRGIIQIYAIK
jgi:peptide/nickel transport system substrate-binding protein